MKDQETKNQFVDQAPSRTTWINIEDVNWEMKKRDMADL